LRFNINAPGKIVFCVEQVRSGVCQQEPFHVHAKATIKQQATRLLTAKLRAERLAREAMSDKPISNSVNRDGR
jgi:hypothetical protein